MPLRKGNKKVSLKPTASDERADVIKRQDNLHMDGQIDSYRKEWATNGERMEMVRHEDNLRPEGQFQSRISEEWAPGERAPVVKRPDNLKPEGKSNY